ncbi:hypothetical protein DFH09DRAFT_1470745 [Mycena vulgaris]|nr:hypothetical protein DFH09DRAFT_1470745 [Mycena vulgaris]
MAILPIIDTVLEHAFHVEELVVLLSFSCISFFKAENLPLLHTLTFGPAGQCPDRAADPTIIFDQAPNVKLSPFFDPFSLVLPWPQLTTLHAICLHEHELMEILRLAVNLVHCSVALSRSNSDVNMPVVAPHAHLQDLTFTVVTCPIGIAEAVFAPASRRSASSSQRSKYPSPDSRLHVTHPRISEGSYREALPSVRMLSMDYSYASDLD